MRYSFSFRNWFARLLKSAVAPRRGTNARHPSRLTLEQLESRLTPANTLSIADSSVLEPAPHGTVNMDFTVTRTGDLSSQLTVGYTTVVGTAQPNTDFTPTTGTTTFASGVATATIAIPVFGNGVFNNPSLTFSVQLTGVVGPPVTFANHSDFTTGTDSRAVAVADLNGDGLPDLVVTNFHDNTVSILLNTTQPGATTSSFATQQTFATGTGPNGLAIGDLNGDGRPDLIVTDANAGQVSVLLNTTQPGATTLSFATHQDFNVAGSNPTSVVLSDVNGDGKLDLIIDNSGNSGNAVSVLLNTTAAGATTASFATHQDFAIGNGAVSVAAGDLNSDGKPDLVVTNMGDNTVGVLLNTTSAGATTASFATEQTFATGTAPTSIALGDLTGDGKLDLVVANQQSGTVSVLRNTTVAGATTASFAAQQTFAVGAGPHAVTVGDVNGDGKPDILVANQGGVTAGDTTVSVLQNLTVTGATSFTFAAQQTFPNGGPPGAPFALALGDLNKDGRPDLVFVNESTSSGSVSVLLNTTVLPTATPAYATAQLFTAGGSVPSVAVGDLNGDGKPDLVFADFLNGAVDVLLNTTASGATTPTFAAPVAFHVGGSPITVALADFNGDGELDIAVATETSSVSVLRNTTAPGATTASFATAQTFNVTGSTSLAVGDINGDGKPDIIADAIGFPTNLDNGSAAVVLLNTTTTGATTFSFATQQTFATGNISTSVAVGDLNGDGLPDLVLTNQMDKTVSVLFNETTPGSLTAAFGNQQTFATGNTPRAAQLADLNGDGKLDILLSNYGDGNVAVLLNTMIPGSTTASFATQQTFATGSGPEVAAVADLNGDGKPDLVVPNINASTLSLLLNTTAPGATTLTFAAQQTFAAGNAPLTAAVSDLNGDSLPDLLGADNGDGKFGVLLGSPAATITRGTATGTITESDVQPTVQFSAASESVSETAGSFSITVTLSTALNVDTTIPFTLGGTAVSGTNYSNVSTSPLVIAAGSTTGTITGTILDDHLYNTVNHTLTVTLGTPTNAVLGTTTTNTLTITESDAKPSVQFSTASESVNETAATFSITVSLSAASGVATTIPFTLGGTAVAGTNYSNATVSPLVIPAGSTSVTLTGTILDDHQFNTVNHTLIVTLGTPTNATLGTNTTNTLTITESDAKPSVQFSSASEAFNEKAGNFTITVSLSAASGVATTIPFTLGGTAVAGTNYSNVTVSPLVIAAGSTTGTITGKLLDDHRFNTANLTLTLTLGTPTNATLGSTTTNSLIILEGDTPPKVQFAVASETVSASAGTFSITVTLSAASSVATTIPFSLGGTAQVSTDYSGLTASPLVIPAGQTSGTITAHLTAPTLFGGSISPTLTFNFGPPTNATLGAITNNTLVISKISTRPSFPNLTPQERFVQALYLDELGRQGTQAELDAWLPALNGPGGQATVVSAIQHSSAAEDYLASTWYQQYLGRAPQNGEEMFLVNQLQAGVSEETALSLLLSSSEFYARSQVLVVSGTADQRLVQNLYQQLLDRQASAAELNAWVGELPQLGRQGIALALLQSAAFRDSIVEGDYNDLLHRFATTAEVTPFANSSLTLASIRAAIEGSGEFLSNG